jgi:gliding motility-associated-like protein
MKKITFLFFLLFSICGFSQLAQEDFEESWSPVPAASGNASDWLVLDNGTGLTYTWVQVEHSNATPSFDGTPGTHAAYLQRENVTNGLLAVDYLVTPEFVVPVDGQLRFESRLTVPFDNGGIYKIKVLPPTALDAADDIDNYVDIYTWSSELALNPIQTDYYEKIVDVPAIYAGTTVRIAFVMEGDNMDRWLIDNAKVVSECFDPTGLTVVSTTLTSAQLSWVNTAFANSWEIEILPEGVIPTGHGLVYNGVPPYTATATATGSPLASEAFITDTWYRYYIRTLCADTGISQWAGPFDFKTLGLGDSCTSPLEITTLPFSDTDNTANFDNMYQGQVGIANCDTGPANTDFFVGNEVVYRFTAAFTGNIVIDFMDVTQNAGLYIYNECSNIGITCLDAANSGQSGNPVTISDFPVTAGEDYYMVITSNALDFPTTPYTLMIQQQGCEEPVGLPVSNITTTSAIFSWSNPTMASSWELQVQETGIGVPAGAGEYTTSTNTGFEVADLLAATNYEYYVRADCGNGTFSAWSGPYPFSTSVCQGPDQCIYTFVMKDSYADGWVNQTMKIMQNGITLATLTGPPAGVASLGIQVPVCNNMSVEVFWNEGFYAYEDTEEIGLEILNSAEQLIYTMPQPPYGSGFQGQTLYNGTIDCDTVLCVPPAGLEATNATMNSIDLSWNGPATGNWEYYIVETGEAAPSGATPGIATIVNPVLGVPLAAPAANYDVYVRMLCEDNSFTGWGGPVTFGSSSCPAEDKCNYVFTMGSFYGSGWMGGYMTITQNGIIVANIGPSFVYGASQSVTVPLCDDMPFEIFWTAEGDGGGGPGLGYAYSLAVYNSFGQTVFSMPDGSGALLGTTIYAGDNDCDYPLCVLPEGLYAENTTTATADIGWAGVPAGDWEYYIVEEGQPGPVGTTSGTYTANNPAVGVPLTIATNYEFYVRMVCENNPEGFSGWAGPFPFYTQICEEEEKCLYNFEILAEQGFGGSWGSSFTISQGGNEAATITMDSGEGYSKMVQVALCPDSDIEIFWNNNPGTSPIVFKWVGLKVYDPYWEFVYQKDFGEGETGSVLYSGSVTCAPPACLRPLNLTVTDITLTNATLHWDEMGDADQWMVWVLPFDAPAPVVAEGGVVVTQNPYIIGGLDPSSAYVFYVMSLCGDDGNSTLSFPYNFTTPVINDECSQAIPLTVNSGSECIESVTGTTNGATFSGILELPGVACGNAPGYPDTWYSFVAENDVEVIGPIDPFNGYVMVFEGDCNNLTQIFCYNIATLIVLADLTVGETYYLKVRAEGPFTLCIRTPDAPIISVSDVINPQQLVEQMLFGPDCGTVSNVSVVSGSDFGFDNSVGYFNQNGSDFPMQEGIIVATGALEEVPGPCPGTHTHPTSADWPGDPDMTAILPDLTYLPSSNASVIEFDFVPSTCHIGFDFMFASHIYGFDVAIAQAPASYLCESNNGCAVLLTGPMSDPDPATINLAVIPGTDTPVSVTTINSAAILGPNNVDCPEQNPEYFHSNWDDPLNSPIAYGGQTTVMEASAQVLQGETYHIKIVIEDKDVHSIGCHDSAIFIKGKACSDVAVLGTDLTEEEGSAVCYGGSTTINTNLDPSEFDFVWSKDGTTLEGETLPTLTVTGDAPFGEGTYEVFANYEGTNCGKSGSISIEFYDEIQFAVSDISICQGTSGNIAVAPVNFAAAAATYSWTHNGETLSDTTSTIAVSAAGLYEVTITLHGCTVTGTATVTLLPLPVADNPENVQACVSYALPELSPGNNYFTGTGGTGIELSAGEVITSGQTLFVYAQSNTTPACYAENSFEVTITPAVQFNLGGPYIVCADEEVEINVSGANFDTATAFYEWTVNGQLSAETGSSITASEFGIYTVTVTAGGCPPVTQSVQVQENTVAIAVLTNDFCEDNVFMLEAISVEGSFNEDTATYNWTGPNGFSANTQQFAVPVKGLYNIVVTTPEGCVGTAVADILSTACVIQRGISPNNDGKNDFFDLANLDVAHLAIFNRYGINVYEKDNYAAEWHGNADNGDELPTGTYFYVIERRNGEQITGWIYINREE